MDTKQPEALRIADDLHHSITHYGAEDAFTFAAYEAEQCVRALHAENETLRTCNDNAQHEIAALQERVQQLGQLARDVNSRRVTELEAQLEAVGAGGVEPLRKRECGLHQISEPAQPEEANDDDVICPNCVHQFRAIPVNVQRLMLDAGFVPPFTAAPTQSGEYPADTGNPEADRIIGRLASSDPDFDDCADAAALIFKLVAEHKCPDGYATWKDAAVAERLRRLAAEAQSESEPPPLPRHEWLLNSSPAMPGYTAEQMRTYRAARGAAQAAPADAAVQQDAERMDWLAEQYIGPDFRWGGPVTEVVVIEMPKGGSYCGDFRADIDAARAAQGGT